MSPLGVRRDSRAERRRNLARIGEIAQVAARNGFGFLLRRGGGETDEGLRSTRGVRARKTLEELGPTFVKFGQLLSTRPDVVPADIVAELRMLQDAAKPISYEEVAGVIREDLGLEVERVFAEFSREPIASASIGQVHLARLPDGREVVVKVQRPDAERQLTADIQLLYQIARIARERVRRLQFIDVVGIVDELSRTLRRELDYEIEARNAEVFAMGFAGVEQVEIPPIHWRYTTSRVLTMGRVGGTPLSRLDLAQWPPADRERLARRITETWMQMVFEHGFFHADPHPANILVQDPDRLGLVDFGMVEQLTRRDRENAVRLLMDILAGESDRLPRRLRALGVHYPPQLEDELAEQLSVIIQRYSATALGQIDVREVLREIFQTIYRLDVTLPARWVMLDKTLATLAGVASEVHPGLNVFETARPYARRIIADGYRPDRLAAKGRDDAERYLAAFREYPFQIADLLEEFKDGEFGLHITVEGQTESVARAEGAANRLSIALLAVGLFMGSAITGALLDAGPSLAGFAVVAIPGVLAGLFFAAILVLAVLRSGRW
jgi:ubiquinone biosynthesis protein